MCSHNFYIGEDMSIKNTDIFGRKAFFIAPDNALIPLSFMEDFCTLGFESHILNRNDGSLAENIKIITEHFPDSALFFNVDAPAVGIDWLHFMRQLRLDNADIAIGVVFESTGPERTRHVEAEYENVVTSNLGCIGLSHGKEKENFASILSVLEKSGAKGRRNSIRAKCDNSSSITFGSGSSAFRAQVDDVNISHISCVIEESDIKGIKIYDKIRNANICVNGFEFSSDVVLIMKRNKGGIFSAVFMFIKKPEDEPGLASEAEAGLNKKIYQITSKEFTDLLHR